MPAIPSSDCINRADDSRPWHATKKPYFDPGDHVYCWCQVGSIAQTYQHHGIVTAVYDIWILSPTTGAVVGTLGWHVRIADFGNWAPGAVMNADHTVPHLGSYMFGRGWIQTYAVSGQELATWHKVTYQASHWEFIKSSKGTCTLAESDNVEIVLQRLSFLVQHPELLPDYNVLRANCESVAVWCKTGTWATLQANAYLFTLVAAVSSRTAWSYVGTASARYIGAWAAASQLSPLGMATIVGGLGVMALMGLQKEGQSRSETLNAAFEKFVLRMQNARAID